VTVNSICPGPFATDMNRQLLNDPVKYQDFVARIPMGRWGELHEIAGIVRLSRLGRGIIRHRDRALRRWWLDRPVANSGPRSSIDSEGETRMRTIRLYG
jgi:NAD(P)-dependent dehydrogenase (short-subunit alcohol dehydrogenase family)